MPQKNLGTAPSWEEAFQKAASLLFEDRLTAVALVSPEEFETGKYFVAPLKQLAQMQQSVEDETLRLIGLSAPMLYPQATAFQLYHSPMHFEGTDGWLLTIVYS
jgi:hypothetical protein